jgi:hypothetical protein
MRLAFVDQLPQIVSMEEDVVVMPVLKNIF